MEIFKARCPACAQDFDCDVALLGPQGARLHCPWCSAYFNRDQSPRLFANPNRHPQANSLAPSTQQDFELREFPSRPRQ